MDVIKNTINNLEFMDVNIFEETQKIYNPNGGFNPHSMFRIERYLFNC